MMTARVITPLRRPAKPMHPYIVVTTLAVVMSPCGHHGVATVIMLTTPRTLHNYEPRLLTYRPSLAFVPYGILNKRGTTSSPYKVSVPICSISRMVYSQKRHHFLP